MMVKRSRKDLLVELNILLTESKYNRFKQIIKLLLEYIDDNEIQIIVSKIYEEYK